ncbi:hypothetical protein INT45_007496 [Circinella minor]|uniref:Uncharacterized protein n=1 Tax=Circinella minor TaxID=1195481 RepID=A0A8H7SE74_9FUNG|nr:hypothetical protein INT45_007496 [Circinella minor]
MNDMIIYTSKIDYCSDSSDELSSEKGYDLSKNNFIYPIRKEININLTADERHYNDVFGSFRSKIENQFSEIAHHKLWEPDDFEFPFEAKLIDIVISNSSEAALKKDEMLKLQEQFLNFDIDDNMNIDNEVSENDNEDNSNSSEDDIPKFKEKKRRRKA